MSIWHKLLAAENQRFCSCRQTVLGESLNCSQTLQGLFHMSSVISLNICTTSNSLMPISEHFSPYFNVVHIMHYIHINFLPTNQPLMPIFVHNTLHYILLLVVVYVSSIFREPHVYCSIFSAKTGRKHRPTYW